MRAHVSHLGAFLLVFIFFWHPMACSKPTQCTGKVGQFKLNPNESKCTKDCECNNLNYTGVCVGQGTPGEGVCVSIERPGCSSPGEPGTCIHHILQCEGIRTCSPTELGGLRFWGDCLCKAKEAPPKEPTAQEPPVSDASVETLPEPVEPVLDAGEPADTGAEQVPEPDEGGEKVPDGPVSKATGYALIVNGPVYVPNEAPKEKMSYTIWDMAKREAVTGRKDLGEEVVDLDARIWGHYAFLFYRRHSQTVEDEIVVLDAKAGWSEVARYKVGASAFPVDIAVVNKDKAFVALYNKNFLLILKPFAASSDGSYVEVGRVDLSSFAEPKTTPRPNCTFNPCKDLLTRQSSQVACQKEDSLGKRCQPDGLPEPFRLHLHQDKLYVLTHGLDRYKAIQDYAVGAESKLITIDARSNLVIGASQGVAHAYPTSFIPDTSGKFFIPEMGTFLAAGDGGLERFDPSTGKLGGILMNDKKVAKDGGDGSFPPYGAMVVHSASIGYAVMIKWAWNLQTILAPAFFLVQFDPSLGRVTGHFKDIDTSGVVHIALNNGGELYAADQILKGLRVFDAKNGKLLSAPIPTSDKGLAPVFVRIMEPF